jgi:UDP-N-acetyl-D-glucosamine dehydrogenase
MNIAIIGLGYVGLPLAILAARKGHKVIGLDLKQDIVESINMKKSHIKDECIQNDLKKTNDNLIATTNSDDIKNSDIFIICVPTPVDNNHDPDFKPLISATKTISKYIKNDNLIIVESTIFPGTCEEIVLPILEETEKKFFLAHCPERVNPGDAFWNTENIPRVVGALTPKGAMKTAKFYQTLLEGEIINIKDVKQKLRPKIINESSGYKINSMPLGSITIMNSIRDAEAVKAMENTVRDVNIAFVNELAKISEVLNLDVVDIIDGMSTKPFGKGPFYPGIGVGGHCIAVDPEWLKSASVKAGYFPNIIQLARDTNNSMPIHAVNLLEKEIGDLKDKKIAILGVSYKKNIGDPRESPFFKVKEILKNKNAIIEVYDPWIKNESTIENLDEVLDKSDYIILVTDHDEFKEKLTSSYLEKKEIKFVIDGRNCLDLKNKKYHGIGR